jgi:hypothetical protein
MKAKGFGTRTIALSVAVGLIGLVGPPSAGAATQIGETFTPNLTDANVTEIQSGSPGNRYAAPFPGVITSWSFQASASPPPQLKFKVGRHVAGNDFKIVGEEGPHAPSAGLLNTYPAQIAVQAGDLIGLHFNGTGHGTGSASGYAFHYAASDPPPGTTATFDLVTGFRIDVSAILEPDCDADGFGDESQDPDTSSCNPQAVKQNRLLTLDANKNKVKKGKKVLLSGRISSAARQGPCESSQTVELQRKRPKQPSFTTFAQVQTDAQGSFSLKKKLKKTFEFRAQVVETAACTAALSNSEKVKVKKKK